MNTNKYIGVVGGGPAGLMAAETAVKHGYHVTVYDAMPSLGRKLLVAGKSGLNLTYDEKLECFTSRYRGCGLPKAQWHEIIASFDNTALRKWALELGIETFTASSGKVFPKPIAGIIRAAPLLRQWISRLKKQGVMFKTRHCLQDIHPTGELIFEHTTVQHDAVVLALGGASWPSTGSDGKWTSILTELGIQIDTLIAANCGWEIQWPEAIIQEAEGLPIKNIQLHAGGASSRGELVITRYGIEGGPIYRLGPELRSMPSPAVMVDFKPDTSLEQLIERMGNVKRNFVREARRRWNLDAAASALLKFLPDRGPWTSTEQLAGEVKNCKIDLSRPRPVEEAISSGGGICWHELNENLMLKKIPGLFAAGEMLNWEAPTGGYLMQGCFSSGHWAGKSACDYLS